MCSRAFKRMLAILPDPCVNTPDTAGRTVLHWAVAHDITGAVEELLESGKAKPDVTFHTAYIREITAFHLIILYEHMLPDFFYFDYLKDELKRHFCQFALLHFPAFDFSPIHDVSGPVAWAIQMGRNKFVNQVVATEAKTFWMDMPDSRTFDDWLHCNDFISIELLEKKLGEKDPKEDSAMANTKKTMYGAPDSNQYSAKQACANLLLQAGADILARDKFGRMAEPGAQATNEARIWWYEFVAKETLNIKNDLNAAGTGTAVVATLVATASFVGPLQPPLNYVAMSSGTATVDVGVQVTEFMIRVFLVSNGLSFYLAIAAIMLAIMPSLPIPKEGLVSGPSDDLKRSRRTISIAIGMLLASIISVLISFAASSLVVIPLQHRGVMAYSTSIGGFICCIGIIFFFLRFLRLICPRNTVIKKLYQKIGIL
ncbi:hypothetical protein BDL97_14G053900 [Sphagnum fallax]|nr:hypothetical protein BDL97_14G053900 [Sphagnum fallax]